MPNSIDLKILVVDDSASVRYAVKRALLDLGCHDISEAADGDEAVHKLEAAKYHIIVSDWNMPHMVVAAIKEGATNYIGKPFTAQTLHEKLGGILRKIRN